MLEKLEKRIFKLEKENKQLFHIVSEISYDLFKANQKLEELQGNLDYFQGEIEQLFD
ncbi:hypothetical protein [Ruoffia sp. FAM 20858]|uniref:hypothetical protein n=1 Tax=Ruoffia sp. FAM 20858 TaxID=3259516 RepID=UPI003883F57E